MCFIVFCKQCGFEIKDDSLKKCPKCNTSVGKGGRFCSNCGKKLNPGEKCDCLVNISSEKCESVKNPVQNTGQKDSGSFSVAAVPKQTPYIKKEEHTEPPTEVNKRIAGNPLLEKIARGENDNKSKEIIRNEAVKIVYGKDMTVEKLQEQRAAEIKAEEERKIAEQKRLEEERMLQEQKRLEEEKKKIEEKNRIEEEKRLAEQKRIEKQKEDEKKRLENQKNTKPVQAFPYPNNTPYYPAQTQSQQKPINSGYSPTVQPNFEQHQNQVPINQNNVPINNNNDSRQLFPDAFRPENMSYQNPVLEARQKGPTSGPAKPIKKEKNFDGMWVAGLISIFAAFQVYNIVIGIILLVISLIFGIVDVFMNQKKTGIGVIIGSIISMVVTVINIMIV